MTRPGQQRGFTLLESTVAIGILALALMAIFDITSGAVNMHAYQKKLTVASLLARDQMTELEQMLYDDGFPSDDREEDGDFSEQGWPNFKWRARILAPDTQNMPPEKVIAALFNVPLGGGEGGGDDPLAGMMSMFMGGAASGAADALGGGDAAGALGGMGGMGALAGMAAPMIQGQFQQLVDQLGQTVREVHLTVYWQDGNNVESLDLVTHVVSTGPGSDRNVATGTGASAPGSDPGGMRWVDTVTGEVVQSPQPDPRRPGAYINPRTGNPAVQQGGQAQTGAQQQLNQMMQQQRGGGITNPLFGPGGPNGRPIMAPGPGLRRP